MIVRTVQQFWLLLFRKIPKIKHFYLNLQFSVLFFKFNWNTFVSFISTNLMFSIPKSSKIKSHKLKQRQKWIWKKAGPPTRFEPKLLAELTDLTLAISYFNTVKKNFLLSFTIFLIISFGHRRYSISMLDSVL